MRNKIFKKVAIGAGIILGILVCAFIALWLWGIGKFVDAKYEKPPAKEKLEKVSNIVQSFVNTELLKNAPVCNAPEVTEGVYNILQENYLVDGESTVRMVEVESIICLVLIVTRITIKAMFSILTARWRMLIL